ncbi:MAG: hypothetical protein OXC82_02810 [Rhodobacteraceae bacterium]|nr:hypothetical protein [Paracoccaceae bacterium]
MEEGCSGSESDIAWPTSRGQPQASGTKQNARQAGGVCAGIAPGTILFTDGGKHDFDQENGGQKSFFLNWMIEPVAECGRKC